MKKKFMGIVLAAAMVCGLAACGSSSSSTASTASAASEAPASSTEAVESGVESTADTASSAAAADTAESAAESASTEDSDVAYIKDKGSLIVGITDFEPMDYKDDSGNWIGFDADLATKVAEDLGVEVQFVEIDWDNKILELNGKSIDVVWNGMTLTDEVTKSMDCTNAYCNNAQVVVMKADQADSYTDAASMSSLQFAVESGSAGEEAAEENNFNYTALTSQADTLLEVESGTSDACIIDLLMASAMTGEGTSYSDLTHTLELTTEEYGVGCRQGSDLRDYINDEFKTLYADGTMTEIAEKYGLADAVIAQE